MSLLIHPVFETNALEPSSLIPNRIYERANLFTSESARTPSFMEPSAHKSNRIYDSTNLLTSLSARSSAFTDIRALNSSRLSTYFWENSNISKEFVKPIYENEFAKTNACKNLWTSQEIPRSRKVDRSSLSCKSTELWRPFSSPPRDETFINSCVLESQRSLSNRHVITPSTVKIGPSKTSVFEPQNKEYNFSS